MNLAPRVRSMTMGVAPFAAAALVTWGVVPIGSTVSWSEYVSSVLLLAMTGLLVSVRVPGRRVPGLGLIVNSFVFLAAVAILRDSAGGINSTASGLSLIPVFYTALYGRSRVQLGAVLAGVVVFYLTPIMLVGAPSYPNSQYRAALLQLIVASIVGFATQRLVARVRHEAGEARDRERMLRQVTDVVRNLFNSTQARGDVCEAARTIGDAALAVLYEPVAGTELLRSTAMAGIDVPAITVSIGDTSALAEAFRTGRPVLIEGDHQDHLHSPDIWEAAGKPQSLLYQPVLRGTTPLGVLVVGWPSAVRVDGPRATVVALLAHEAAAVIDRADVLDALTGQAQTDALTGLPNRRAWDAQIKQAVAEQREFTVAMLDFDHFKEFNDTYGHPAGDRLLKQTGALWRDQLRAGDLLARLGGEEFGLLLLDTDHQTASIVIERLRERVSDQRTCSAGIAVRRPDETAESVIARADRALYDAKKAGRDRALISS